MERIGSLLVEVILAYFVGFILTCWFYFPVQTLEEIFLNERPITQISLEEFFWGFVAFSMSAVMGLYFVSPIIRDLNQRK